MGTKTKGILRGLREKFITSTRGMPATPESIQYEETLRITAEHRRGRIMPGFLLPAELDRERAQNNLISFP